MTFRFEALIACGFDDPEQDGTMIAGIAESDDEEDFSLTFMCNFDEPDEQDVRLGFDSHCVVTPDQNTAYGCVRQVELDADVLRITLDPESVDALGLEAPIVEAVLRAPAPEVARMLEVLARILTYGRPDARPLVISLSETSSGPFLGRPR
ncbi:Imm10 family immunity protein [Actinacidiphila glaucinigra]|uniref:Immunity protein 10 n=1 Tax=Actinacidiphila glaucinigra TaxID=235986 RepID=A0A238ZTM2_9ACTN|nr:Imm10 family immunity protein [Actinacidiphila glaucinigra]SNR86361.1 Immunity protein 10 [Actinacidiphila glaucinigra]